LSFVAFVYANHLHRLFRQKAAELKCTVKIIVNVQHRHTLIHISQHQNTVTILKHISHQDRIQWQCKSLPWPTAIF